MRTRRQCSRTSGFSIIEVLIAAAILLLVAVGVLPLFTRAMINNLAGDESTRVSNFSKSAVEDVFNRDYNHADVTLIAGNVLTRPTEYWEDADRTQTGEERWTTTAPAAGAAIWERTVEVRQFSTRAFEDQILDPAEALPFNADPQDVHFKMIEAQVEGTRAAGPLETSKTIRVRTIKSQ